MRQLSGLTQFLGSYTWWPVSFSLLWGLYCLTENKNPLHSVEFLDTLLTAVNYLNEYFLCRPAKWVFLHINQIFADTSLKSIESSTGRQDTDTLSAKPCSARA